MTQYQRHQYRSTNRVATSHRLNLQRQDSQQEHKENGVVTIYYHKREPSVKPSFVLNTAHLHQHTHTGVSTRWLCQVLYWISSVTLFKNWISQMHSHRWLPCRRKLNFIPHRCKRRRSCIWQYRHILISLIHIKTGREREILPGATVYACRYMHRQSLTDNDLEFVLHHYFSLCNSAALRTV